MSKSLVFIDDFSKEDIYEIFKLADEFANDVIGYLENWDDAFVEYGFKKCLINVQQAILCYLFDK